MSRSFFLFLTRQDFDGVAVEQALVLPPPQHGALAPWQPCSVFAWADFLLGFAEQEQTPVGPPP